MPSVEECVAKAVAPCIPTKRPPMMDRWAEDKSARLNAALHLCVPEAAARILLDDAAPAAAALADALAATPPDATELPMLCRTRSTAAAAASPSPAPAGATAYAGDGAYLEAVEARYLVQGLHRSWGECKTNQADLRLLDTCGVRFADAGLIFARVAHVLRAHVAQRTAAMAQPPRVVRLAARLRLTAKELEALQFVLVMHAGKRLPSLAMLTPNEVAAAAQLSADELMHFLRESRPLMKQGVIGFCESRSKLPFNENRVKMPTEAVAALSGIVLSSEEMIKLEKTALAAILRGGKARARDQPSASGSDADSAAGSDDDGSAPRKRSKDETGDDDDDDDAQRGGDGDAAGGSDEEMEGGEARKTKPYATDLEYMDDVFKMLATVVKLRNSESDMKDEDDAYCMMPKSKVEAQLREMRARGRVLRSVIEGRLEATRKAGSWLPRLEKLATERGLTELEKHVLLLLIGGCMSHDVLVAINGRYVMRGDTLREFTVGYVLFVLCDSLEERVRARQSFYRHAPLVRSGIVSTTCSSSGKNSFNTDLMEYTIDIDRKIVDHCMGLDTEASEMVQGSRIYTPQVPLASVVLPADTKDSVLSTIEHYSLLASCKKRCGFGEALSGNARSGGLVFLFHGPSGTGKTMLANAVAHDLEKKVLLVSAQQFKSIADAKGADVLRFIFREAMLSNAIVFFDECETIFESRDNNPLLTSLLPEFENYDGIIILATNRAQVMDEAMNRRISLMVQFRNPDHQMREQIWRTHLPPAVPLAADVDVETVAMDFELSGGLIKNAVLAALSQAVRRENTDHPTLTMADVVAGAKTQLRGLFLAGTTSGKNALVYATPRRSMKDVVLPADPREGLELIVRLTKSRHTLFAQWGFEEQDSDQQNIVCLFHGPSGAGKSLAAEAVAYECGYTMRIANTATLVQRGEGESVRKVFEEAKQLGALVVFDAADCLFAASEEADRTAQAIQFYAASFSRPVLVLATTGVGRPISAGGSKVRFTHDVLFQLPNRTLRRELWRQFIPAKVPTPEGGLDVERLSEAVASAKFIRSVCFSCCARAALLPADRRIVTTDMLLAEADRQREQERHRNPSASMFV